MRPVSPGRRPGPPLMLVPIATEGDQNTVRWLAGPPTGLGMSTNASMAPNRSGLKMKPSALSSPPMVS